MLASILRVLGRDDPAMALYVRPSRPLRLTYSPPGGQQQEAQQRQMLGLSVPEALDFSIGRNTVPCLLSTVHELG